MSNALAMHSFTLLENFKLYFYLAHDIRVVMRTRYSKLVSRHGSDAAGWASVVGGGWRNMFSTSWLQSTSTILLLLLLLLLAVDAKLKEVEKECAGRIECLHHSECERYSR